MQFISKHLLIKNSIRQNRNTSSGVTSPFLRLLSSSAQNEKLSLELIGVRLLQHSSIQLRPPLSRSQWRFSSPYILRNQHCLVSELLVSVGWTVRFSPVPQPSVFAGWTGALRYLHWIHTLYMVSCLPLFTCSRLSTRFCTFSSPASVNISWSSSEGEKKSTEIFSYIELKNKIPINNRMYLFFYLEWRNILLFHRLGHKSFLTDTFLKRNERHNEHISLQQSTNFS